MYDCFVCVKKTKWTTRDYKRPLGRMVDGISSVDGPDLGFGIPLLHFLSLPW